MIVISQSLVLSEIDVPEGTPWIGYHNIVTAINIDSTTENSDFPVTNLANAGTHLIWKASPSSPPADEYVTVTTNYFGEIDYLAVAKHNFGTLGAVLSVEGSTGSGSPLWFELVQEQILPDDAPVLFRWEPQVLAGVRLRIQLSAGVAQAGVMYVGKLLVMERGIDINSDHVPVKYGRRSNIVTGMSENGNFLGRVVLGEHRESKAEYAWITPDWYREELDPFVVASKSLPFFYVWNPIEYPDEVGFCWMVNDPEPETDPVTRRVAIDLQMRGVS